MRVHIPRFHAPAGNRLLRLGALPLEFWQVNGEAESLFADTADQKQANVRKRRHR